MDKKTFIQVVILESDGKQSGAEIRNAANLDGLEQYFNVHTESIRRLKHIRGQKAHPTIARLSQDEIASLCETIEKTQPEGVLFEGMWLMEAIRVVRERFPSLRIIIDFHNVESMLYKQDRTSKMPRFLKRLVTLRYARSLPRALEADHEADQLADEIWCCSESDAEISRGIGLKKPIHIVPNPVPSWCFDTVIDRSAAQKDVLFLGHLEYRPNIFAVQRLCKDIMPRVLKKNSDVQLHVCGRSPSKQVLEAVEEFEPKFTADPVSLSDIYASAAVTAIPLTEGGGTRIKILEAMAIGCPIVASSKAIEGLDLISREHFIHAETSSEFAKAILEIVGNPDLAAALTKNAQEYCIENFGPDKRNKLIADILDGSSPPH